MKRRCLRGLALLGALGAVSFFLYMVTSDRLEKTAARLSEAPSVIILDAGHGGEDGGAVSEDGLRESSLNLEIVQKLDQLLRFCGAQTYLIRTDDRSVYTGACETLSEKKISDLKNRVAMVNAIHGGILVSIHQNHFSDSRYSGAQVFYASVPGSEELADRIQDSLREHLDPENRRRQKPAETVYLMEKIQCPGVLVECGFLSNPAEAALLGSASYQRKLACAIAEAVVQFTEERNTNGEV